jgi:polyhydroxyalkanoate synthase
MKLHHDYLDMFEKEPMANPGKVDFMGHKLDLTKVTQDCFIVGGLTDHITPWRAVYRTVHLIGSKDKTFVLSSSGHIQSLINPPGNPKAKFFTNPSLPVNPDDFPNGGQIHMGSWWESWAEWLRARSGAEKSAPKKLGNAAFKPVGKAPGKYVME